MAARAALSSGPRRRPLQARALRRRRRRPQPRPFVRLGGGGAPAVRFPLSAPLPPRPAWQSRSAPQPARTRPLALRRSRLAFPPPHPSLRSSLSPPRRGGGDSSCQEGQARPVPAPHPPPRPPGAARPPDCPRRSRLAADHRRRGRGRGPREARGRGRRGAEGPTRVRMKGWAGRGGGETAGRRHGAGGHPARR